MKRSFEEFDRAIPESIWDMFPDKKAQLVKIRDLEQSVRRVWSSYQRKCFSLNCGESTRSKILRVYIRHQFTPSSPYERSHFTLSVEGRTVDGADVPLGLFFDSIRITSDKKFTSDPQVYEWSKKQYPAGVKGNCFRFKIYGDRNIPIKIQMARSDYANKRYELSSALRTMLPLIRPDPTEDEVCLAAWHYVQYNGLLDTTSNRPTVICDENLRNVVGEDTFPLSSLRSRLTPHLSPARPVAVDYTLTTTSWSEAGGYNEPRDRRYSPRSVAKAGGRCFDLEVDILDDSSADLLEHLNTMHAAEIALEPLQERMERRAEFIVTGLRHCAEDIQQLRKLEAEPLCPTSIRPAGSPAVVRPPARSPHPLLVMAAPTSSGNSGAPRSPSAVSATDFMASVTDTSRPITVRHLAPSVRATHMLAPRASTHSLNTFLDIADDNIFSSAPELIESMLPSATADESSKTNPAQ